MDRLTQQSQWTDTIDLSQELGYKHIYQRLAEYENTGLTPAEVAELAQAKEDGRLVVLPCKLGRTIYIIDNGEIQRCRVQRPIPYGGVLAICIGIDRGYGVYKDKIGKTVFLTKAEAQAALDRMEGQK